MWRIPRIRRIEYALDFLKGIKESLDAAAIQQKIDERKYLFELDKYRGVGRGHPFSKKLRISISTITDCLHLTRKLGFLELNSNILTPLGQQIVQMEEDKQISLFAQRFIHSYESVKIFLLTLNNATKKEIILPVIRGNQNFKFFIEQARRYKLEFDPLSFITVRDILSRDGLINWTIFTEEGTVWQRIYLTYTLENSFNQQEYFLFNYNNSKYSLYEKHIDNNEFKNILWQEYLHDTGNVPDLPAFYSDIRERVCNILKISDQAFDRKIKEIMRRKEDLSIVWSSGTLHFGKGTANLFKHLPPLSDQDQYMIYLLISRR